MRGIILAGGMGTRLYPSTIAVSKQLLPVFNKPMIYYPLSTIMLAGVRDVLLISKPEDTENFHNLLGDGSDLGLSINYAVQTSPKGIPDAISIARHFLANEDVFLVLGDNVIFGTGLTPLLDSAKERFCGAAIFSYPVSDPERYGIVEVTNSNAVKGLVEKPENPRSNLAITGHYMLSNDSIHRVKNLNISSRGETEIIDLLKTYQRENRVLHSRFGRGFAWFDCGTHNSLLEASQFVETIESRQGSMVACLEEIAYGNGWLDADKIQEFCNTKYAKTKYGKYLHQLINE